MKKETNSTLKAKEFNTLCELNEMIGFRLGSGDTKSDSEWKAILDGKRENHTLVHIIGFAPDKIKELAWEKLTSQHPTVEDLLAGMRCFEKKYRIPAFKMLIRLSPSSDALVNLLEDCHTDRWEPICKTLIQRKLDNVALSAVILYGSYRLKSIACRRALRNPNKWPTYWHMLNIGLPKYEKIACEWLLKNTPDNLTLKSLMVCGSDYCRERASDYILQTGQNDDRLRDVMCYGPKKYKKLAMLVLLKRNPYLVFERGSFPESVVQDMLEEAEKSKTIDSMVGRVQGRENCKQQTIANKQLLSLGMKM